MKTIFEQGGASADDVNKLIDACIHVTGLVDKFGQVERDDVLTYALSVLAILANKETVRVMGKMDAFVPILQNRLEMWLKFSGEAVEMKIRALLRVVNRLEESNEMKENPHEGFNEFIRSGINIKPAAAAYYDQTKQQLKSEF